MQRAAEEVKGSSPRHRHRRSPHRLRSTQAAAVPNSDSPRAPSCWESSPIRAGWVGGTRRWETQQHARREHRRQAAQPTLRRQLPADVKGPPPGGAFPTPPVLAVLKRRLALLGDLHLGGRLLELGAPGLLPARGGRAGREGRRVSSGGCKAAAEGARARDVRELAARTRHSLLDRLARVLADSQRGLGRQQQRGGQRDERRQRRPVGRQAGREGGRRQRWRAGGGGWLPAS